MTKKEMKIGRRKHDVHNNRKDTRGRYVQRIYADGGMKPIYHSAR